MADLEVAWGAVVVVVVAGVVVVVVVAGSVEEAELSLADLVVVDEVEVVV